MSIERLHSKHIAVVIPLPDDNQMVVRGVGHVEENDDGDVLRVTTDNESGDPAEDSAILVKMQPKPPKIERDGDYGCDYRVVLD